jgi:hypothetical protein
MRRRARHRDRSQRIDNQPRHAAEVLLSCVSTTVRRCGGGIAGGNPHCN